MRSRSGTPCGDPLVVCREGGLDLRLFQGLRRGVPFYRTESPQLSKRDDGGGLAAKVDDLVRLTVQDIDPVGQATRLGTGAGYKAEWQMSTRWISHRHRRVLQRRVTAS